MTASVLPKSAAGDLRAIRRALSGHLCRCTGYQTIVESVAKALRPKPRSRKR